MLNGIVLVVSARENDTDTEIKHRSTCNQRRWVNYITVHVVEAGGLDHRMTVGDTFLR